MDKTREQPYSKLSLIVSEPNAAEFHALAKFDNTESSQRAPDKLGTGNPRRRAVLILPIVPYAGARPTSHASRFRSGYSF